MVAVMLGVCSIMGLPWFVAATVLSITHVNSLKLESECSAPGEQPKFLGIREQRVTGLMIFILMGSSVFMTSILKVMKSSFMSERKESYVEDIILIQASICKYHMVRDKSDNFKKCLYNSPSQMINENVSCVLDS